LDKKTEGFRKEKGYFVICKIADRAAQNYVRVHEFEKAFCGMNHKEIHEFSTQEI
jgi:hypothetical protein